MKIAELRNKVEFFEEQKVENDTFGFDHVWVSVIQTRGKLETTAGRTVQRGQNPEPLSTHLLTIRTRNEVNSNMRVEINDVYYKIVQINPQIHGRDRYMELSIEQEKVAI